MQNKKKTASDVAGRLEGIGEYYFSRKLREIESLNQAGKNIINLGIGSPDLPPHPDVIHELSHQASKPNVHAYQSYKGSPVLRTAIAAWYQKWYNVQLQPDSEILPLIGSKEGIFHLSMTFFEEGDTVLIPNPGYPTYESAVRLSGAQPVTYDLQDDNSWFPDFQQLEQLTQIHNVRGMFLNYPHMPTGQLPTRDLFTWLVAFAREKQILLIHDNPYSFILNDQPMSILEVPGAMETAVELNSLSKSHNMAGWRVGMLCGNASRIGNVLRFKSNMDSGMFLPVQLAAVKALSLEQDWFDELNREYTRRREKVYELLNALGCKFENQVGLFVWAKVPSDYKDGFALSDNLLYKAGVFLTPGGIFGSAGHRFVRVSLCANLNKINEALDRALAFASVSKESNRTL